jgi:crotonobetainyl-CoA:carnitine CoA-transferase CaiB-like acyl-CoA transferase
MPDALLKGVTVIECALLEPGSVSMILASLGADVIKVEPPGGDYVRDMAWPVIEGVSILHWHINRGKRSIVLDLRTEGGREVFRDLVRDADVVVEGMRPGALQRRGLGPAELHEINPALVFCGISGFGATGPYRDLPTHGMAYDGWAGVAPPVTDADGFVAIGDHTSIGTKTAPVWAALGVVSAILRARQTGEGATLDIAQSDSAAAINWLLIEGYRAYERPEPEVTGNPTDGGARRAPGPGGMSEAVRYQYYATADGYVLFMASEREFWQNFCTGIGRPDLFEAHPGARYADHAIGDKALRSELRDIFNARTSQEWLSFGVEHNCPICPVNTSQSIGNDPQFQARMAWLPAAEYGTDLLPLPINVVGEQPPPTRRAPTVGQHTDEVLAQLGYDQQRVDALRADGSLGGK